MNNTKAITRNDLTNNFFCGVTKHKREETGMNFVSFQSRVKKFASSAACGTSRINEALKAIIRNIDFISDDKKSILIKKADSGRYSSTWSGITKDGMDSLAKDLGFKGAIVIDEPQYNPTNLKTKSLTMIRFI